MESMHIMANSKKILLATIILLQSLGLISCQKIENDVDYSKSKSVISIMHYMDFPEIASKGSRQGCAIWGNTLFVFHNTNDIIEVYDLENKALKSIIKQENDVVLYNQEYHCNNANFTDKKYSINDTYPLLYVSMENINQHRILVLRLLENDCGFTCELIQTIILPDPNEHSLFFPNSYIDTKNGLIWISCYTKNSFNAAKDNSLKYISFRLPNISIGGIVNLYNNDILQECIFDSISSTQGGQLFNGKLYQVFGIKPPLYFCVFDLNYSIIEYKKSISELLECEPEGLFVNNGQLYYTTQSSIYEIRYE